MSRRLPSLLSALGLVFLLLGLGGAAGGAALPARTDGPSADAKGAPVDAPPAAGEDALPALARVPDNDVYLLTEGMWALIERYQAGEFFAFDAELERELRKTPHIFSGHFWAGLVRVRRLMLDTRDESQDAPIRDHFRQCVEKAKKAQKLSKFRVSGLFYETSCEAGLALFDGLRGRYLDAQRHAVRGMDRLEEVLKARPGLHGALLLKGLYNYYTGRFGSVTRFILKLIGLTPGDLGEGMRQIRAAASGDSPVRYFASIYLIYAFAPESGLRRQALDTANTLVRLHPKNYYAYFLRGYVHEKSFSAQAALKDIERALSCLPGDPARMTDLIWTADSLVLNVRRGFFRAFIRQEDEGLARLNELARDAKSPYEETRHWACLYMGHLWSLGGHPKEARAWYRKIQTLNQGAWLKDQGKNFEERGMGARWPVNRKLGERLHEWLAGHPEAKL